MQWIHTRRNTRMWPARKDEKENYRKEVDRHREISTEVERHLRHLVIVKVSCDIMTHSHQIGESTIQI